MYDMSEENVVQVWREDSNTLFIVFSGIFAIAGVAPFEFLKETEFERCNLIYFRDYFRSGYKKGVSENLDSLDKLIGFCQEKMSEKRVEKVAVMGASSGALPALVCAHQCDADRAWALGPRTPREGLLKPMSHNGSPFSRWIEFKITLYQKVARLFDTRAKDWFVKRDMDWPVVEKHIRLLASYQPSGSENGGARDFKVYSLPSNKADSMLARKLAQCPGVRALPVVIPEDYNGNIVKQSGWDHSVIQAMRLGKGLKAYMNS